MRRNGAPELTVRILPFTPTKGQKNMASVSDYSAQEAKREENADRVTGWWVFAAVLLGISGTLDIIWGIAAVANSAFFFNGERYLLTSDLHAWGWITMILGVVKLFASGSLFAGGGFGRVMGILAASIAAMVALVTLPAYPFWGISAFALCILVVYELAKPREAL
jgi:hypothetical protein